jgi:hypothetical protein
MERLDRILNYIHHHPSSELTYHPSNMQLYVHSDASHHSEPDAQSRVGGYFVLGEPIFDGTASHYHINGPILIISKRLPQVSSSTAESEYGGLYVNAQAACPLRLTLSDFGYPQQSTTLVYDNEVAGKVAKGTAKQKRSKAFATRYHWIRDRVRLKEYNLVWKRGTHNLADFFTKAHPVHHFKSMQTIFHSQISKFPHYN